MEGLRKQIKESFFNPILHLLPLLVFLVVEEFFGMNLAWMISFPVALILLVYVYFSYNRIFTWHLFFTGLFLVSSLLSCTGKYLQLPDPYGHLAYETILLGSFSLMLLFRGTLQKVVLKVISRLIPMSNNFSELNRIVWRMFALLAMYIAGNIALYVLGLDDSLYHDFFQKAYVTLLLALVIYEIVRVQIVRAKLLKEEWWPIVNEQGKIIGSVQHTSSLNDTNKYTHPIVRVLIIDRGMVLLQKRAQDSLIYPGLWDTAITNHVQMGESIEQCVDRTAAQRYKLQNFRYMYLSNYTLEVDREIHYAFTFVSCQEMAYCIDTEHTEQLKWWTQHQIEENLESGIFSENFKIEYDLLLRSGLIETGKCNCNCKLKQAISDQANQVVKSNCAE